MSTVPNCQERLEERLAAHQAKRRVTERRDRVRRALKKQFDLEDRVDEAVFAYGDGARQSLLEHILSDTMASDIVKAADTAARQHISGERVDMTEVLQTEAWRLIVDAAAARMGYEV